ncbi:alpha/beta hydrolase [Gelidibacter sp. F2691]|nr:alpha/beta hydrolase [Gelidibacter sp. F2691]
MKELLSDYDFQGHKITLNDLEVNYIKEGSGEKTLVFVHGLSSNADAWSKNIEALKTTYTCVALDLPGYGKSSKPDVNYTPTYFAEVVFQFIEKLKLQNVVLIGHSMGGQASVKLASQHPEAIKKLVLVAPAGLEQFSEASAKMMASFLTAESVKNTSEAQIVKNYALNFYEQPEEVSKMIADRIRIIEASDFDAHCNAIVKSVSGMLHDPITNDLQAVSQPTLVIFGDQDMLIPNRYFNPTLTTKTVGEIALNQIKNARLEFVENAGHFVQFEKPSEINALIHEFIEEK